MLVLYSKTLTKSRNANWLGALPRVSRAAGLPLTLSKQNTELFYSHQDARAAVTHTFPFPGAHQSHPKCYPDLPAPPGAVIPSNSSLPFHRKPRDRARAVWESQGMTGCWQNQPCLLSEPFSSVMCFLEQQVQAFGSQCYFQFAGREEVLSLERMYEHRERIVRQKRNYQGKRARDS